MQNILHTSGSKSLAKLYFEQVCIERDIVWVLALDGL
jgi:hypothetical protein